MSFMPQFTPSCLSILWSNLPTNPVCRVFCISSCSLSKASLYNLRNYLHLDGYPNARWGSREHRPRSQARLDDESSIDDHHEVLDTTVLSTCFPCRLRDSSAVKQQTRRNDRCWPRAWLPDLATPHQQIFPSAISTTLSSELVVLFSLFLLFSSFFLAFCLVSACFLNQNDQTTNFLLFSHNTLLMLFSIFLAYGRIRNAHSTCNFQLPHRQKEKSTWVGVFNFILLVETPVWRFWCLASVPLLCLR